MLADLYARKSGGARPAASKPEVKPVARAFELPPDEKGPPEKVAPVEVPPPEPVAAIEIELEPDGAVGGIEVELGTSERIVTGEIEVPIAEAVVAGTLEVVAAPQSVLAGEVEVPLVSGALETTVALSAGQAPSAIATAAAAGASQPVVAGELEVPLATSVVAAGLAQSPSAIAAAAAASSQPVAAGELEVSLVGDTSVVHGATVEAPLSAGQSQRAIATAAAAASAQPVVSGTLETDVEPRANAAAVGAASTGGALESVAISPQPIVAAAGNTPVDLRAPGRGSSHPASGEAQASASLSVVEVSPVRRDGPSVSPPGLRPRAEKAAPPKAERPKTDLERSLEAFSMFDVDAKPAPSKVVVKGAPTSFTELDLDESPDTLLHAIEAAAVPASSPSVLLSAEEVDAADERKPDPGALPKIPLFSDLPEDAFIALFEQCPLRRFEPGDRILRQGSVGDSFFVICAGSVKVVREDEGVSREVAALEEGSFFGEMALLSDSPRTASVDAAVEDTQLLEISGAVLKKLSAQYPAVSAALKKFCRQRLLANLMNSAPLFRPFSKGDRRELVQKFRARDVGPGETLIHEGQATDGLYVVLAGEVAVLAHGKRVAAIKEGEVFGEMSLLTRGPATATVMSTKRTSLLRLPRDDFDRLIMSHPQILELVAELTDARRRQNEISLTTNGTAEMV